MARLGMFTFEQYMAGLTKAQQRGVKLYRRRDGALVFNTNPDASGYWVTPGSCTCQGHKGTGHCYHRAYLIFRLDQERWWVADWAPSHAPAATTVVA